MRCGALLRQSMSYCLFKALMPNIQPWVCTHISVRLHVAWDVGRVSIVEPVDSWNIVVMHQVFISMKLGFGRYVAGFKWRNFLVSLFRVQEQTGPLIKVYSYLGCACRNIKSVIIFWEICSITLAFSSRLHFDKSYKNMLFTCMPIQVKAFLSYRWQFVIIFVTHVL